MQNKSKVLVVIALVVIIGFSMMACGGSSLVGKWEEIKNDNPTGDISEFFSDGTLISDGIKGEWKTEKNRIIISVFGMAITGTYKISGSTLTVNYDDGDVEVYKKVK